MTLRVLIATNQLDVRAGSELFSLELAQGLAKSGHKAALFTLFPGDLYQHVKSLEAVDLYGPADLERLREFKPEIIHSHHVTCGHIMAAMFPEVARVHGVLGILPPLEQVPRTAPAPNLYLAVSEEVRDTLLTKFEPTAPIAVMRNWFVDADVVVKPPGDRNPTKVVVVSNHWLPEIDQALAALATEGLVETRRFGLGHESRVINGDLLSQFDLVVTIGRTALLAAACGIPCILAGPHGSDGLLTTSTLDAVRRSNFSGRTFSYRVDAKHLMGEIAKISARETITLMDAVTLQYSLGSRIDWLLSTYDEILSAHNFADISVPSTGEADAFLDMAAQISRLQAELAKSSEQLGSAMREIDALKDSSSWRITEPLRRAARRMR